MFLRVALCVVDDVVAPVYGLLTIVVLASCASPFLRTVAAHGKTRNNNNNVKQQQRSSIVQYFLNGDMFLVQKLYFRHFYVAGLISTISLLWFSAAFQDELHRTLLQGLAHQCGLLLLFVHLARRWLECRFVHVWNPSSKMHIGGYVLGVVHYSLLAFVFVPPLTCSPDELKQENKQQDPRISILSLSIGVACCIFGQYEQYCHHCLLAKVRRKNNNVPTKASAAYYGLPSGRWFRYVSCPHYFAEILIYVGFAILLEPMYQQLREHGIVDTNATTRSWASPEIQSFILFLKGYRHFVLFVWVVSNLTVSATRSHEWYKQHFHKGHAVSNLKSIIPFLY